MIEDAIVIVGAGGHAKVCIELLQDMGEPIAFCTGAIGSPERILGIPVRTGSDDFDAISAAGYRRVFIAIGNNKVRARLGEQARTSGLALVNAISPDAKVSPTARLGSGIAVMAGAVINAETQIDDLAIVNTGATIDHDCLLGLACHVAPNSALAGNVTVGARSFLGIGARVIPGVTIGSDVELGAGGVVIKDLPGGSRAVGAPARILPANTSPISA